jgi:hypothetical protein
VIVSIVCKREGSGRLRWQCIAALPLSVQGWVAMLLAPSLLGGRHNTNLNPTFEYSLSLEQYIIAMSGFEVVGVVLGVLPLLISTAEHYNDVFKPFKRFKRCAPELELYQQQLKTQMMIFLNQCQLLLTSLAGRESAKEMLQAKYHTSWNDNV